MLAPVGAAGSPVGAWRRGEARLRTECASGLPPASKAAQLSTVVALRRRLTEHDGQALVAQGCHAIGAAAGHARHRLQPGQAVDARGAGSEGTTGVTVEAVQPGGDVEIHRGDSAGAWRHVRCEEGSAAAAAAYPRCQSGPQAPQPLSNTHPVDGVLTTAVRATLPLTVRGGPSWSGKYCRSKLNAWATSASGASVRSVMAEVVEMVAMARGVTNGPVAMLGLVGAAGLPARKLRAIWNKLCLGSFALEDPARSRRPPRRCRSDEPLSDPNTHHSSQSSRGRTIGPSVHPACSPPPACRCC